MTTLLQQNTLFDNLVGPTELQEKESLIFHTRENPTSRSFTNNPSPYHSKSPMP